MTNKNKKKQKETKSKTYTVEDLMNKFNSNKDKARNEKGMDRRTR